MKDKVITVIVLTIIVIFMIVAGYNSVKYRKAIETLTSLQAQQIEAFRIYPKVIIPRGHSRKFEAPDTIIDDFFSSLSDIRHYRPSHDTVDVQSHNWFLEISSEDFQLQISFYIPSEPDNIVIGQLGAFGKEGEMLSYGYFQSHQLLQWYKKHNHRWLESEN